MRLDTSQSWQKFYLLVQEPLPLATWGGSLCRQLHCAPATRPSTGPPRGDGGVDLCRGIDFWSARATLHAATIIHSRFIATRHPGQAVELNAQGRSKTRGPPIPCFIPLDYSTWATAARSRSKMSQNRRGWSCDLIPSPPKSEGKRGGSARNSRNLRQV